MISFKKYKSRKMSEHNSNDLVHQMHKYDTALGARPLPTVQKMTENIPWVLLSCNWASKLKLFIVRTFKTTSLATEVRRNAKCSVATQISKDQSYRLKNLIYGTAKL